MTPRGATIRHQYKPATGRKSVMAINAGSNPVNPTTWSMTISFFNVFKKFAMRELQSTKLHGSPRRCVEEIMLRKGQKGRWPHHSRHIARCGYFTRAPTSTYQGALHFGGGSWKVMSALRG